MRKLLSIYCDLSSRADLFVRLRRIYETNATHHKEQATVFWRRVCEYRASLEKAYLEDMQQTLDRMKATARDMMREIRSLSHNNMDAGVKKRISLDGLNASVYEHVRKVHGMIRRSSSKTKRKIFDYLRTVHNDNTMKSEKSEKADNDNSVDMSELTQEQFDKLLYILYYYNHKYQMKDRRIK